MRGGTRAAELTGTGGVIARIIASGQTGVARGALSAAIAADVVHGGWCPAGGWAEDKAYAPGVLIDFPGLKPTIDADPATRTRLNVRDAHATVIIASHADSPGTQRTMETAKELGRPYLVDPSNAAAAHAWLAGLGRELIVNIAGPRESERPGVYDESFSFVRSLLALSPS